MCTTLFSFFFIKSLLFWYSKYFFDIAIGLTHFDYIVEIFKFIQLNIIYNIIEYDVLYIVFRNMFKTFFKQWYAIYYTPIHK